MAVWIEFRMLQPQLVVVVAVRHRSNVFRCDAQELAFDVNRNVEPPTVMRHSGELPQLELAYSVMHFVSKPFDCLFYDGSGQREITHVAQHAIEFPVVLFAVKGYALAIEENAVLALLVSQV